MMATIFIMSYWMNRSANKPSLFIQCGFVVALFLFLTPGFGVQYLVWLVPFTIAAGLRPTLIYYVIGSIYIALAFGQWSVSRAFAYAVLFGCWLATLWVVLEFYRRITAQYPIAIIVPWIEEHWPNTSPNDKTLLY
jgi:hypothetical protein